MKFSKFMGLSLCLGIFACLLLLDTSVTFGQMAQEPHGDQSPAINAEGDVSIIYKGLSLDDRKNLFSNLQDIRQLIDELFNELNENEQLKQELANEQKSKEKLQAEVVDWAKKYEELRAKTLALEDRAKAAEAKAALIDGDLDKAKRSVTSMGFSASGVSF